ncbi:MAG: RtcB family protein [Phycisphaerae bacterium]|nr:RtcB family protein [Phycisphaerae bacterium]
MADQAIVKIWTPQPLEPAVRTTIERLARAPDVRHVAIMPDVHLAAGVSNGVAVATKRLIYPAAVGGDIGCGFAVVALRGGGGPLRRPQAEAIFAQLPSATPVMRHRRRDGPPELLGGFSIERLTARDLAAHAAGDGRLELGTLGRGNHFLELQRDDDGEIWLMVHSGSRAMGQHITSHYLRQATSVGGGLATLDVESDVGRAYLADIAWARAYAAESRRRMLAAAATVLSDVLNAEPDWTTLLNTDHNHVQWEHHEGEALLIHRKGANSAAADAPNVIPGSMATHTFHVCGRGEPTALNSSSHGAGRRLSRGAARSRIRRTDLSRQLADVWIDPQSASRLTDEAPAAYKDIDAVMRAQRDLVRIVRRLTPVLSYKGA